MRLPFALLAGAWLGFLAGVIMLIASPPQQVSAHAPHMVSGTNVLSWGALGVYNNWYYGCSPSCTRTVAIIDRYGGGPPWVAGLSSSITNSTYYPHNSWSKSDNPRTKVVKATAGVSGGTAIYIYQHCCYVPFSPHVHPDLTHIHTFGWNSAGQWVERPKLDTIFAWVGDVHLRPQTVASGPDSAATVLSHEVGHALGLADEGSAHDTIMLSPNPGIRQASTQDRRTEEFCLWTAYRYFPC